MTDARAVKDAIRDLLPTFRERADETERLRVVPDSSIKELEETGFFRLLQPRRFDGLEADPIDFYTCVKEIAGAFGFSDSSHLCRWFRNQAGQSPEEFRSHGSG